MKPLAPPKHSAPSKDHDHHHPTYAAEATGLLLIAIVLLILTVIRYWQSIVWSAH